MTEKAEEFLEKMKKTDPKLAQLAKDVARIVKTDPDIREKLRQMLKQVIEKAEKDE